MKSLSIQAGTITGNGFQQQQLPWHGLTKSTIKPANNEEPNNWIYVVGKINALFPSLSLEQEFLQASQIAGTPPPANSMASDQVELEQINSQPQQSKWLYNGLSQPQNLYIAREMNWVLENTDNNHLFSLLPTSNQCLLQLISALSPDTGNIILVGQRLADGRVAVSNITATNTPALQQVAQQEQSKAHPLPKWSMNCYHLTLTTVNPMRNERLISPYTITIKFIQKPMGFAINPTHREPTQVGTSW